MCDYVVSHGGLGALDVALVHLRNAVAVAPVRETWIVPYAHLAIAQTELKGRVRGVREGRGN